MSRFIFTTCSLFRIRKSLSKNLYRAVFILGLFKTSVYSAYCLIQSSRYLVIIRHIQKWLTRVLNPACPWHFKSVAIKTLPCSEHVANIKSFLLFSIKIFIQNPYSKPSYTLIIKLYSSFIQGIIQA